MRINVLTISIKKINISMEYIWRAIFNNEKKVQLIIQDREILKGDEVTIKQERLISAYMLSC